MIVRMNRKKPLIMVLRQDVHDYFIDEAVAEWTVFEQDDRSLSLSEIDLSKVKLIVSSEKEETISGEEKLTRLKTKECIRLDYCVLREILMHGIVPDEWNKKMRELNVEKIFFDGTILQDKAGKHYVPCLRVGNNRFCIQCDFVDMSLDWSECHPSAVIPI